MTDREALIAAVCESPDDDTPRLIFADWCEEHGEPERAEFVRLQIELARADYSLCTFPITLCNVNTFQQWAHAASCPVGRLRRRERELWPSSPVKFKEWFGGWLAGSVLSRGFIESVSCSWADFLAHGKELLRQPLQRVLLTGMLPMVHVIKNRITFEGGLKGALLGEDTFACDEFPGVTFEIPRATPAEFARITGQLMYDAIRDEYSRRMMVDGEVLVRAPSNYNYAAAISDGR